MQKIWFKLPDRFTKKFQCLNLLMSDFVFAERKKQAKSEKIVWNYFQCLVFALLFKRMIANNDSMIWYCFMAVAMRANDRRTSSVDAFTHQTDLFIYFLFRLTLDDMLTWYLIACKFHYRPFWGIAAMRLYFLNPWIYINIKQIFQRRLFD